MMRIEGNRRLDRIADFVQSDKVKAIDKFYLFDNHKNSQVHFGFHENNSNGEDGPSTSFVSANNNQTQKDGPSGSLKVNRKLSTIEENTYESRKSGLITYGKGLKSNEAPKKAFESGRSSIADLEEQTSKKNADDENQMNNIKDNNQQRAQESTKNKKGKKPRDRSSPKRQKEQGQTAQCARPYLHKSQLIDDVYDERVVLANHTLYTLREGNVLQYMSLMELEGFSPSYIQKLECGQDDSCPTQE